MHLPAASVWAALALLLATAIAYAPVRHYGFLNYDDNVYVTGNAHVAAGLTRDSLVWAWTGVHDVTWHPLTSLSHLVDVTLFGLDAGWHHLHNVALHVLNTLLLFGVLVAMTGHPGRAACVAGLFALHPLRVESVAWIAERKDVLSGCFWMLALWAYVAYVRRPGWRRYALLAAAFAGGLLSKPMVVTLPFVLLLLDFWPLCRLAGGPAPFDRAGALPRLSARRLIAEKLPLLLLALAGSVITYVVQQHAGARRSLQPEAFGDRLGNALVGYVTYLRKTLWPSDLAVFYPFEAPLPAWQVLGAGMFLVTVTGAVLLAVRRAPYACTGWLWFVATLVPVIGIVPLGGHAVADRYTYLPSIGLFLLAVWGIAGLLDGWSQRRAGYAVAGLALVGCMFASRRQLPVWRSSESLFRHALAVTRNNYVAHVNLGMVALAQGATDQALEHLTEAVRIKPDYAVAQYDLGLILARRGDRAAAATHYLAALRANPRYAEAHNNLGVLLAADGDHAAAVTHYREATRLEPGLAEAYDNLGISLERLGDRDAAIAAYAEGIRLSPGRAEAQCNLAELLGEAGRVPEAAAHFQAALRAEPTLQRARYGLAIASLHTGATADAVAELEALLRQDPDLPVIEALLAWVLATTANADLRDGPRAVRLAESAAARSGPQDLTVLNSLAAAYAEVGRFDDAAATAARALTLATAGGSDDHNTAAMTARLARYRAGQPTREVP